jgi:hypothetical protein
MRLLPKFITRSKSHREQAFSKIKNILRKLGAKLGARTHEALLKAMEEALCKVTPADAAGWFGHCGYQVEVQYL